MLRKRIETVSIDEIRILFASSTRYAVSDVEVFFFWTHCRVLPVWV